MIGFRRRLRTPKVPGIVNRTIGRLAPGTLVHPNTWEMAGGLTFEGVIVYLRDDSDGTYYAADDDLPFTEVFPCVVICHIKHRLHASTPIKRRRGAKLRRRYYYRRLTRVMAPGGILHISSHHRVGVDPGAIPKKPR